MLEVELNVVRYPWSPSGNVYDKMLECIEARHKHDNKNTLDYLGHETAGGVILTVDGKSVAFSSEVPSKLSTSHVQNTLNGLNVSPWISSAYLTADGFKILAETLQTEYAKANSVPDKTSQLTNDSGFITKADIPTDESYELIGQTPLTLENGGNIKLVANGETNYSMVAPTVWNFDDAELKLSNVELDTSEGYYKFTAVNEMQYAFQYNVVFSITGLEVGRNYKFVFDLADRPDDFANMVWNGYVQPFAGTKIAGSPIATFFPKDGSFEFTATDTTITVRYVIPPNQSGTTYVGWIAAFNKMYLNYAEMSDTLTEKYSKSGTFTDIETFKSIPSGAVITTDPTASVYRKTPTDKTLTQGDVPADAEITGKEITGIKSCLPLFGKTIINFGDSIFGKAQPPNDISTFLANKTGATVCNFGFGGCKMTKTGWDNDPFSMCGLSNAIANNDYNEIDSAFVDTSITLPDYFATSIEKMKNTNFSKVDIVTIAYGINDFTSNINIENAENAYDQSTLCGALRYSIETLLTAYPNLRIFVCSLTYRYFKNDANEFVDDSNTHTNNNGNTILEFNAKLKEVAEEYNLPFIDNYNIGISKFNRTQYFSATDGTHHQIEGRKLIAERLAGALSSVPNGGAKARPTAEVTLKNFDGQFDGSVLWIYTYDEAIPTGTEIADVEVSIGQDTGISLNHMFENDPNHIPCWPLIKKSFYSEAFFYVVAAFYISDPNGNYVSQAISNGSLQSVKVTYYTD